MKRRKKFLIILIFLMSFPAFSQNVIRKEIRDNKQDRKESNLRVQIHSETNSNEKRSPAHAVLNPSNLIRKLHTDGKNVLKSKGSTNTKSSYWTETILSEDFEGAFPGTIWTVYASSLAPDAYWDDTDYGYYTGEWSCWCAGGGTDGVLPGTTYPANMEAWMIFGPFDLSLATSASLSFKNWLDTEADIDMFRIMASVDGINYWGDEFSGSSSGWVDRSLDLKFVTTLGDVTGEPEVWIAFQFVSDETLNYLGSYIDDIILEKSIPGTDLMWTNMVLTSDSWQVGSNISADLTEFNDGTEAAAAHFTKLYLSTDITITSSDTQLGTDISFSSISAGGTQVQSKTFAAPDVPDGLYYLGAIVDFYNTVAESDETNNNFYRLGQVTVYHASTCPAPTIGTITQTSCTISTGSVVLTGLPSIGTWTLTRTPGNIITTGTGTSTTISGLAAGTYSYTVTDASACTSPSSGNIIIFVQPVVPPAPTAGNASLITSVSFTANWISIGSATGYMIDVATNSAFTALVTGFNNKDAGNVNNLIIDGLNPLTTYYYRVRAYSLCGTSSNSNAISLSTTQTPPVAPVANEAVSVLQTTMTVKWSSTSSATGYRLDLSSNSEFSSFVSGYNDKDVGNVLQYNITGLTPGTTYYYRLRAYNSGGSGPNSNTITSTTLFYPPLAPEIGTATEIRQTSFNLAWSSVATSAGYRVDIATNNSFTSFVTDYNNKDIGNVTSVNISNLLAKTTYYCRIRAYNSGGTSPNSNIRTVTTLTLPPPVPSGVSSLSCNDLVTLKWRKNTGSDFLRYYIFGGTTANPTVKISESTASASDTVKIISGLIRGQTYFFRITAVNYDGAQSDFSEQTNTTVKTGVIPKIKVKWNDVLICYNLGDSIKSFQWFNGNNIITGANKQYYQSNKIPGNYKVEIIDLSGCKNTSAGVPISGISNINAYPNPSAGSFNLAVAGIPDGKAMITIINQAGFKIMEFEKDVTDNMLFKEIYLNNMDEGVYLIQIRINNDSYYSRIVIAR